jgi:hypothetical protein
MQPGIFLALADPVQTRLWRHALVTQTIDVNSTEPSPDLPDQIARVASNASTVVVLLDVAACGRLGRPLEVWINQIKLRAPNARVVAVLSAGCAHAAAVAAWAVACGAHRAISEFQQDNAWESITAVVESFPRDAETPALSEDRFRSFLRSVHKDFTVARATDPLANASRLLTARNLSTDSLWRELRKAVPAKNRRYRLKNYRICIVAEEAVEWLTQRLGITREQAVLVGRLLQSENRLYHVVHEHDFSDDYLFFRYAGEPKLIDETDLTSVIGRLQSSGGLDLTDQSHNGRDYRQTFRGSHFVERVGSLFPLGVEEAASVGQLLIALGVIHNVDGKRPFVDGDDLYRFYADARSSAFA